MVKFMSKLRQNWGGFFSIRATCHIAHDYNQSNSATIYKHWTQQTQNEYKNKFFIIARLKVKSEHPLGASNPQPWCDAIRRATLLEEFSWWYSLTPYLDTSWKPEHNFQLIWKTHFLNSTEQGWRHSGKLGCLLTMKSRVRSPQSTITISRES